jgi:crotonobetainyl-CoA:carnitine CoA-transferase CaiB-like acyl-CoA transferase
VPGAGRRRPGLVAEVDALETLTLLPMQPLAAVQLPTPGASRRVGAVGGRLGGTLASRDGEVYVRLVEPVQWSRLLTAIAPIAHLAPDAVRDPTSLDREAATINPALAAWIRARTTDEVLEEGRRLQIPVAPFVDPARLPADTHLVARGYADGECADLRAPWIVDRMVPRATPSGLALHPTATQPLHGLRVLDLSWAWAGPFATTLLAELGADVVNIEWLPRPSNLRVQAPAIDEFGTEGGGWWSANQRGKRSVALDLKDEEALGAVLDLAAHCDIAIENFSAGVADRLGLGFDALVARNPDLVYLSMSAYGATGPRASERGYGTQLFASAGYSRMLRGPTGAMSQMGIPLPDPISGLVAAIGLVAHLGGDHAVHLDASELEATVAARGVALDPTEERTAPAIHTFAGVLDDDYLRRRGAWMVDGNAAFAGRGVRIARAPWRIDGQRPPTPSPAPILGAHTVEVLRDVSGWDAARIEALVSSGAALAAAP